MAGVAKANVKLLASKERLCCSLVPTAKQIRDSRHVFVRTIMIPKPITGQESARPFPGRHPSVWLCNFCFLTDRNDSVLPAGIEKPEPPGRLQKRDNPCGSASTEGSWRKSPIKITLIPPESCSLRGKIWRRRENPAKSSKAQHALFVDDEIFSSALSAFVLRQGQR